MYVFPDIKKALRFSGIANLLLIIGG